MANGLYQQLSLPSLERFPQGTHSQSQPLDHAEPAQTAQDTAYATSQRGCWHGYNTHNRPHPQRHPTQRKVHHGYLSNLSCFDREWDSEPTCDLEVRQFVRLVHGLESCERLDEKVPCFSVLFEFA